MPGFWHLGIAIAFISALSILVNQQVPLGHDLTGDDMPSILAATTLDTTVIVLNWSRFPNVINITSTICRSLLQSVVESVIVWNNNPRPIAFSDFGNTACPKEKLNIVNSPENLRFQARYIACAEARTRYCFVQDDDYLVLPEVIRALTIRIKEASLPSIHLQPAGELLSSQLRTIFIEPRIHTTFAWLGYGTIIRRTFAIEFLSLLDKLQLSIEEHQMADNYFTILSNTIPERWFDPGIFLGGGQPFTVGTEGEERNNRHIVRAAELLDFITSSSEVRGDFPYVDLSGYLTDSNISRAPCIGPNRLCVFETSIKLLSDIGMEPSMSAATEILSVESMRLQKLGHAKKEFFLGFPPSSAVDGQFETAFRSPDSRADAKKDEWITLDLTRSFFDELELVLIVGREMGTVLQKMEMVVFETSRDGTIWYNHSSCLHCEDPSGDLIECSAMFNGLEVRFFRLRYLQDVNEPWVIHEIFVDSKKDCDE